jgi:hypothetical protein
MRRVWQRQLSEESVSRRDELSAIGRNAMIVRPENPIAIQLYTVREPARADFPGTLRRLAEGGARAVEFAGYGGMPVPELRSLLDELGMRVAGSHVPLTAW